MRYPGFLLLAAFAAILIAVPLSADQSVGEDPDAELSQTEDLTYTDDSVGSRQSLNIISVQTSACDKSSGTGTAEVYLGGNVGIYSMKCIMIFNRDYFTPTGITSSGLMDTVDHDIHGNICMVELISPTKGVNVTSAGLLFTVTYQADDDVPLGMHPVFIDVMSPASVGAPPRVETSSGIIFVSYPTGDVNGDGKVSLADSLAVRKAIAGQGSVDTMLSDLNNDGRTDSTDSLLLRKIIAGWDVGTTPAYDHGDGRAKVFIYDVVGIGYGPFHVFSTMMFEVQKAGVKTQFAHAAGDTYTFSLESGESLKIMNASSMGASERAVIYELNGGNLDWSMPVAYTSGGKTDLGCPTNDDRDLYFIGWFTDEECTESILYIPADATGTVTVYALWDDTLVGHGYKADMYIEMSSGATVVATFGADCEMTYWARNQADEYLVRETCVYSPDMGADSEDIREWQKVIPTDGTTDGGFVLLNIDGWTVQAHKYTTLVKPDNIAVVSYYIYGWVTAYQECLFSNGGYDFRMASSVSEIESFEVEDEYSVFVYSGYGIDVPAYQTVSVGGSVTLTAVADQGCFGGWYDLRGNLISEDPTVTIDHVLQNTVIVAKNSFLYDEIYQLGECFNFTSEVDDQAHWRLMNLDSMTVVSETIGKTFIYTPTAYGHYGLFVSGTDEDSEVFGDFWNLRYDRTVSREFVFNYGTTQYKLTFGLSTLEYNFYCNYDINRDGDNPEGKPSVFYPDTDFVTYNDMTVKVLADVMADWTKNMNDYETANFVLRFVQEAIPYATDSVTHGVDEYWNFPVETLFIGRGDCEDTAILYCAVMKAMGYDVALMTFSGHALAGVNIEDVGYKKTNVRYETVDGMKLYYLVGKNSDYLYLCPEEKSKPSKYYFICETTGVGADVGDYSIVGDEDDYVVCTSLTVVRVVTVV